MNCHLSEITELKYTSLIKIIILEENFKWHLEGFASELFNYFCMCIYLFFRANTKTDSPDKYLLVTYCFINKQIK